MKILEVFFLISIVLISTYVFDKITSENPTDSANIIIGISNIDSESCLQCLSDGESFDRGCKACPQDNINFRVKSIESKPFISSWSKNNAMFYGDDQCTGEISLPFIKAETNKEYWTEIKLKDSKSTVTIYDDKNFESEISTVTNKICTLPSELKFLRFSMNDGQPAANGGRLIGTIDNIQIFDSVRIDGNSDKSITELVKIYEEDFSNCNTKECKTWTLQNPNAFFVDTEKNLFYFDSSVSGTNDYAHYELSKSLSETEWILRLVLSFDSIDEFPHGKGLLQITPTERNLFFLLPSLLIAMPAAFFSIKRKSLRSSVMIIIFYSILFVTSIIPLSLNNFILENQSLEKFVITIGLVILSSVFLILGISKIYLQFRNNSYR